MVSVLGVRIVIAILRSYSVCSHLNPQGFDCWAAFERAVKVGLCRVPIGPFRV